MKRCAPTASAAAAISSGAASGPAERDVLGDRAAEEEALLRHDPELAAQRVLRHVAQVVAVDRDPALGRVVEARDQLRDRRLAGAGVADERDGRAGRDVEIEPVQHLRELRPVAEADVRRSGRGPSIRGSSRASSGVDDLRLLVEHADDLVERRDRGEERVVELRELLDRVEEVREVEREGEERAGRHVAVVDEPAAVAEHDRGRRRREQVDDREVDPVQDDRLVVRVAVAVVDAVERRCCTGSRVNDWTTRMPAMSSASVAVTRPSRSRTFR